MKTKTFGILYLDRGEWKLYNNDSSFTSVEAAKKEIDDVRNVGKHPLCLNRKVAIYQFDGKMIIGNAVRY